MFAGSEGDGRSCMSELGGAWCDEGECEVSARMIEV